MFYNIKTKILLILTCLWGIILIFSELYSLTYCSSTFSTILIIFVIIGLIIYLISSIYTIFTISKLKITSLNLDNVTQHNKTLEKLQDNTRAFRHDFPNILQGIGGYISRNDLDGLKVYYSELVDDVHNISNLTALSPEVINNPAIYNVLANKYYKADNLNIKINLEIFINLNDLHMKIYEFTRILGILMDNAIEAAAECNDKIINVTIGFDKRRHMQFLLIENTYKNKNIDKEKIYEKGYSTKAGNTGLGLWEVRQILKKNNNLNLYTDKNNKFFIQQLEIYYSSNL